MKSKWHINDEINFDKPFLKPCIFLNKWVQIINFCELNLLSSWKTAAPRFFYNYEPNVVRAFSYMRKIRHRILQLEEYNPSPRIFLGTSEQNARKRQQRNLDKRIRFLLVTSVQNRVLGPIACTLWSFLTMISPIYGSWAIKGYHYAHEGC